jgi:hypothetical protein
MCQPVAICTYETADGGLPVGAAFDVTINSSGTLGFTWGVGGTTGAIIECTTSQENAKVSAFYTLSVAPFGIASDSSNFYWTNENAGTLQSAPTGTSSPVTTLESSLSNPVGVATFAPSGSIASTQVIYSTGQGVDDYNTTSNSSCFGGTSLPYFMGIGGPPTAPWLAVSDVTGNAVYATALSSCTGTSGIGRALVPIANNVPGPDTAVTDGTTAFFGTRGVGTSDGAVFSCPVGGCSPQNNPSPYVASQGTVGRLALDGNNLIWTSAIYGLRECSKLGCTTPTNLASSVYTIAMVAQGGTIYYVFGNTLYSLAE